MKIGKNKLYIPLKYLHIYTINNNSRGITYKPLVPIGYSSTEKLDTEEEVIEAITNLYCNMSYRYSRQTIYTDVYKFNINTIKSALILNTRCLPNCRM